MRISEVSEKFDLTKDTLRYYERIGLIPEVERNKRGNRDYSEYDCKWIGFVKCMRNAGIPIEVLIEYLELFQQGEKTLETRKELLVEQRDQLIEEIEKMKSTLDRLNYKIDKYEQKVIKKEKELRD
ncbi:MAG: MerR family transcriptional regulator [Halanaerobiales bacterium]